MTEPLLEVQGLAVEFATAQGWSRVVDDVSFSISQGETLGLLGESGCGKSVTSLAVMGLLPPRSSRVAAGSICLNGRELTGLSERELSEVRGDSVSMIFQEPMTSLDPAFRVGEQIRSVLRRHRHCSRAEAHTRAVELLELVGIPEAAERVHSYPHQFSGGMRQRVMIAIALACEPDLLIADEPTTALDVTVQKQIIELLADLQARLRMGILFVTHDLAVISQVTSRVVVMYAGQVVEQAATGELFQHPQHPYAEGLLGCLPAENGGKRLQGIPGLVPSPLDLPGGCRFHPRCRYAEAGRCDVTRPQLDPQGTAHAVRCLRAPELKLTGIS